MKIIACQDSESASRRAADYILSTMHSCIGECGLFNFAVGGGSAPPKVYKHMVESGEIGPRQRKGFHLFWGDERSVPNDHPDSNVRQAREHLVVPAGLLEENIHAPNGGAPDLEAEALRYEEVLRDILPVTACNMPTFDLNFLGMGPDGHTASLFPNTEGLREGTGRAFIANKVPQKDTWRLSLTLEAIRTSRQVLIVATGEAKAPVLAEVFHIDEQPDKYPVDMLYREGADLLWIVDEAALSHFTDEQREAWGVGSLK